MDKKFIPKRSQEDLEAFFRKNGGLVKSVSDPKPQTNVHIPETLPEAEENPVVYAPQEVHVDDSFSEPEAVESLPEVDTNDDFSFDGDVEASDDAADESAAEEEDLGDFEVMVEMEVEESEEPAAEEEVVAETPAEEGEPLDLGDLDLEKKDDDDFNFDF